MPWLGLAAILVGALALRHVLAANTDVSWLLTVAERVLDGQRLYVDVIEINPPMAVLAYIPGIVIARTFGLPAETVTDFLVVAAALASLAAAAGTLRKSALLNDVTGWPFALLTFAILTIVPAKTFGQREHIAAIALLPLTALYAVRMMDEQPSFWSVLVAGLGAGIAMSFKPYFAIGILCGVAALTISARSWRILPAPENWIAGTFVAIYGLCVIRLCPEFVSDIAPLVGDVYIKVGASASDLFSVPAIPIWATSLVAAIILNRSARFNDSLLLLLAMSSGFMLVFLLQRKGWPSHSDPGIAFALLGLSYALTTRAPRDRMLRIFGATMLAFASIQSFVWFNWAFDKAFDARPLWSLVASLDPHPRILAITGEPGLGHPMVRELQGQWVSRQQSLWVSGYVQILRDRGTLDPERETKLQQYAARERAALIADITRTEPTVVLVDNFSDRWSRWLADHPDVANRLSGYRPIGTIHDIEVRAKQP
jgi:hypothetical protein